MKIPDSIAFPIVAMLVGLLIGALVDHNLRAPKEVIRTIVETVPPKELLDSLTNLTEEVGGLRARLAGRRMADVTAVRVDTVYIEVPDTVILGFTITQNEALLVSGTLVDDTTQTPNPVLQPRSTAHSLPGDCDDGITVTAQGIVCDSAVLGHLDVFGGLGAIRFSDSTDDRFLPAGEIGIRWRPSYASRWSIAAQLTASAEYSQMSLFVRRDFLRLF